jgi:hypothetical protein
VYTYPAPAKGKGFCHRFADVPAVNRQKIRLNGCHADWDIASIDLDERPSAVTRIARRPGAISHAGLSPIRALAPPSYTVMKNSNEPKSH